MNRILSAIILSVLVLAFVPATNAQTRMETKLPEQNSRRAEVYTYVINASFNGTWGYSVFVNDKMLIRQLSKPGLPGNEGFKTKRAARKVALLVIAKLKKGEMPPTITAKEMQDLKVL